MNPNLVSSFAIGMSTSLAVGSPAEAFVHRYFLHAKPKERNYTAHGKGITRFVTGIRARIAQYVDNATYGHQECHHAAYKQKEHYYRDVTNESEVIHFALGDVGIIAAISATVGSAVSAVYASLKSIGPEDFIMGQNHVAYAAGFLTGTMAYYGGYEIFHHNMHVIGKRRLEINRVLGDNIQGGIDYRDSKLRISKPLLDDICNAIEDQIDEKIKGDRRSWSFDFELEDRLDEQVRSQASDVNLALPLPDVYKILSSTAQTLLERERLNPTGYLRKKFQWHLRNSPVFQRIDNHHFVHHVKYLANLNVLFPMADVIVGTKVDSSKKELESNRLYWLCPNSPDVEPFVRPPRNRRKPSAEPEELMAA